MAGSSRQCRNALKKDGRDYQHRNKYISMSKYKCVLPTSPFEVGQIVELTAEQVAFENAVDIRFVAVEEEVVEETPAEEVAEESSADAEISTESTPETVEEVIPETTPEVTTEETATTDAAPEGEAVVENTEEAEVTPEAGV